jgi:monoamine oxidase
MDSYLETLPIQIIDRLGIVWDGEYVGAGTFEETLAELPITPQALQSFDEAFTQLSLDYEEIMQGREFFTDIEPEDPLWETLEGQSCQDYLSRYQPQVYQYLNAELGGENAGEISTLSALLMAGWYGSESEIPRALVEGGNQVFAEDVMDDFLAAGGRLELDSEVTEVKQDGDIVQLTCSDGRGFSNSYVVVETPADTAKDIVVDLPSSKFDALDAVKYSSVAVIGLHIQGIPSGEEVPGLLFVGDSDVSVYINQTGEVTGNPETGTVISAVTSDAAVLQLDDDALMRAVIEGLRPLNPGLDPEKDVLDYAVQRWTDGVPKLPPGFLSSFETNLREPAGRVYFAGDYGYDPAMGGASRSGIRVASSIIDVMEAP